MSAARGVLVEQPEREIWRELWFQRALAVLLVLTIGLFVVPPTLAALYAARSVLVPLVVAMALAYAVNPVVAWLHRRWRIPRPVTAVTIMLVALLALVGLLIYIVPKVVAQAETLAHSLPTYLDQLSKGYGFDFGNVSQRARDFFGVGAEGEAGGVDLFLILQKLFSILDVGYEVVSATIGFGTYLIVAIAVIAFCFYFFVWHFNRIFDWFIPFIPAGHRERTLDILRKMDASVSAFIRGRLIQATVVACVLSVGWLIADVPYWLLLGVAGGMLNLIPYAAVAVWPIAVLLTWLDTLAGGIAASAGVADQAMAATETINATGQAAIDAINGAADATGEGEGEGVGMTLPPFDWLRVLVWPTLVYVIAQGLDGWVVEPLVQGQATNLDTLTVLIVVLLGAAWLGLLGMLIAIPTAACVKILAREVVLPRLRTAAAEAT